MGPIGPSMQDHISSCPQCRQFFEVDEEAVEPPTFVWGGLVVGREEEEEEEGFEDQD